MSIKAKTTALSFFDVTHRENKIALEIKQMSFIEVNDR